MPNSTARDRMVDAAFDLFEEQGFDHTTIDDLTERAGVGRTTFFRHFRTKEDVVLADHEALVARVEEILDGAPPADLEALARRVADAAEVVLHHYLDEGERARRRYRLSTQVPAIRSREVAGMRAYQRTFHEAVALALGGDSGDPAVDLDAALVASGVITATHHVLRRWLREETSDPEAEFAAAIERALSPWLPVDSGRAALPPHVVAAVRRATPALEALLAELKGLEPR